MRFTIVGESTPIPLEHPLSYGPAEKKRPFSATEELPEKRAGVRSHGPSLSYISRRYPLRQPTASNRL